MNKLIFSSAKIFFIGLSLLTTFLVLIQSCTDKQAGEAEKSGLSSPPDQLPTIGINPDEYNNTKGYWENGQIITEFNCPDAVSFFPPIDIKSWDKIPAVNGRFPTYAETKNGTSIHHYGEKKNPDVRPYNMMLPKLAYRYNPSMKKNDLVVVIQIVQTKKDTIVGFRYLTGGCGGSLFRDYHFLTDDEVQNIMKSKL